MKLNIGNKILLLLHWLCSLMICVAFVLCLVVPGLQANLIAKSEGAMGVVGARIAGAALLALYLALSVVTFLLLIRRRKRTERGFIIVGPDEKGRVRIAVSAVEQMVRQSVRSIDGISDMKVDIEGLDDAIGIGITAAIASGAHVPTITSGMKRAITQFVEVNCGVAVQSVEITINSVSGKAEPSRRWLMGRNKPQPEVPAYEAETPVPEAFTAPRGFEDEVAAAEPVDKPWDSEPATSVDVSGEEAPAYDPYKPYESEFAKDYAAMKAREGAVEPDSGDANDAEA